MNLSVRGVHYQPSDETNEFLNKKLQKIQFAEDYINNLDIVMKRNTIGQGFSLDAVLHFKWGSEKIVSYECYELYEGIEMLVDKIESVARKEKAKVVDK